MRIKAVNKINTILILVQYKILQKLEKKRGDTTWEGKEREEEKERGQSTS